MTAILKRVDDPRSLLQRARRTELVAYARANGLAHISADIPADIIRDELLSRGLTRPPIPNRVLGVPDREQRAPLQPSAQPSGNEVSALADLKRQFAQPAISIPPAPAAGAAPSADVVDRMTIIELGNEMKRLKIKRERRDNMIIMREKIKAHG
jgi:hypothetical protein